MSAIDDLLDVSRAYARAEGVTLTAVSWRLFGDSKKLDALVAGADIQVRRFEAAMSWLAGNWPEEAKWPSEVPRPLNLHPAPPSEDKDPRALAGSEARS